MFYLKFEQYTSLVSTTMCCGFTLKNKDKGKPALDYIHIPSRIILFLEGTSNSPNDNDINMPDDNALYVQQEGNLVLDIGQYRRPVSL